jgi:hypothetical protein
MKMAKYYSEITRDIVREISMGALVATSMRSGSTQEIAPPRVHRLPLAAGSVAVHRTKADRDRFIAAINADHPGAAIAV